MILALFDSSNFLSDESLMEKYRTTGNTWYVGELYKRYSNPVSALCFSFFKNREETEDAVMEVFELIMKDLLKTEVQQFKPWLITVVRHYCLRKKDKLRKEEENKGELKNSSVHFMEFRSELSLDTIDKGKSRDIEADLALAIQDLKEEQRVCVELFFLKDKSYQDIADETGYPLQKVKSYIQNGKRNLKIFLESKQNG